MEQSKQKIREFTDLIAWQEGHKLVLLVYQSTNSFPRTELYSLTDQIRRCVVSITSNIAEGFGRQTYKEKIQYYYQSQGSLTELKNQIIIAKDVGYLTDKGARVILEQATIAHRLLQGLITASKRFLHHS